nr:uncharacterized mitochondrial protein AtMg00810-like [Ipomoea batatas]
MLSRSSFGSALADTILYHHAIGLLQYLSITRSDIIFIVNRLSRFLNAPTSLHWQGVKRVLRYLKSTDQVAYMLTKSLSRHLMRVFAPRWVSDGYTIVRGRKKA